MMQNTDQSIKNIFNLSNDNIPEQLRSNTLTLWYNYDQSVVLGTKPNDNQSNMKFYDN